jgi:hypothetical protein
MATAEGTGWSILDAGYPPNLINIARRFTVTVAAGTIIDAVAALFFVQSNKARELMVEFFDRLRKDRKLEESLRIAANLPDKLLSSRLGVIMALNLADAMQSDELVSRLLDIPRIDTSRATSPADAQTSAGSSESHAAAPVSKPE